MSAAISLRPLPPCWRLRYKPASAAAVSPLPAVQSRRPCGLRGGGKAPIAAAFWSSFVGLASRRQPRGERIAARYAGKTFAAGGFGGLFMRTEPRFKACSRASVQF